MAVVVKKGDGVQGDINVTPLIDVVLVLLIIFMVLTPIVIEEMAVDLPKKTETVPQDDLPEEQLLAAVCEDGTFALNREVMPLSDMEQTVSKRLKAKATKVVFVDAHPDAPYERVVTLMDAMRASGATRLGVGNLKTADEFRACEAVIEAAPVAIEQPAPL